MLIKPIAYWQGPIIAAPVASGIPKAANILFRYENPNTNNVGGTRWVDTSGLGYTTGSFIGPTSIDATSNSVICYNTGSNDLVRTARVSVTTNQASIVIKSIAVVFNQPSGSGGTSTNRNYFADFRRANNQSPNNGGYFNQYDSVGPGAAELYGNDGNYFAYNSADGILLGSQLTTPANLTNGTDKTAGGTANDQWMGPNGKSAYTPIRMWLFNFNTSKDLTFTNAVTRLLSFGASEGGPEGSTIGWFSIVGWSTYLDATDAAQLVNYYKSTGALPT
jgi:hypothetical protein